MTLNPEYLGDDEEWDLFKFYIDEGLKHLFALPPHEARATATPRSHVITCPHQRGVIRCIITDYLTGDAIRAKLQSKTYGIQNTNFVETIQNIIRCFRPKGGKEGAGLSRLLAFCGGCRAVQNRLALNDGTLWLWETDARRLLEVRAKLPPSSLAPLEFEERERAATAERLRVAIRVQETEVVEKRHKTRRARRQTNQSGSSGGQTAGGFLDEYDASHNVATQDERDAALAEWSTQQAAPTAPPAAVGTKAEQQEAQLMAMKQDQLKVLLKKYGLRVGGRKKEQQDRLRPKLIAAIAAGGDVVAVAAKKPPRCNYCGSSFHVQKRCPDLAAVYAAKAAAAAATTQAATTQASGAAAPPAAPPAVARIAQKRSPRSSGKKPEKKKSRVATPRLRPRHSTRVRHRSQMLGSPGSAKKKPLGKKSKTAS